MANRQKDGSWELSYKSKNKCANIAEPTHRVPPEGVTNGISFRALPKSCVEQVRDICVHYVTKCSGKYGQNVAASRYVHQMADEVINQLAGVAADIKKHVDEPEVLQKLLDDWNESFPPALGELGTPKAIAAKLERQHRELEDMKQSLEQERLGYESDITGILHSVDSQLEASRKGVLSERRQLARKTQFTVDTHKKEIEDLKAHFEEEKRKLIQELSHDAYLTDITHSKAIATLKAEHSALYTAQENKYKELSALHANDKAHYIRSKTHLTKKMAHLEDKYQSLRAGYGQFGAETESTTGDSSAMSVATVDSDAFSVSNEPYNNDNDQERKISKMSSGKSSVSGANCTGKQYNLSNDSKTNSGNITTSGFNNTVLRKMKKQQSVVAEDLRETVKELDRQKENVLNLLNALKKETERADIMADENKALLYTLNQFKLNVNRSKVKANGSGNTDENPLHVDEFDIERVKLKVQDGKLINTKPNVLKHTPHRLQHTRQYSLQ